MKRYILKILSLLLVIGVLLFCTEKKELNYINYNNLSEPEIQRTISSNKVVSDEEINRIVNFELIDKYLILIDSKSDKQIRILDIKNYDELTSFGNRGEGPNEFIGPSAVIRSTSDESAFWIYDMSVRKVKMFYLDNILSGDDNPDKIISLNEGTGHPKQVVFIPNDVILASGFFFSGRISLYNSKGNFVRSVGEIPYDVKDEKFVTQHSHGFEGKFIFKPNSQEIYMAPLLSKIIEKYSLQGNMISTLQGPDVFFPEYDIVKAGEYYTMSYNEKSKYGYVDLCYNDEIEKIFLLYSGKYVQDHGYGPSYMCNIVYVMDRNDRLIERLNLDSRVWKIKISHDGSEIYGLSANEILMFPYN